jgi:hypothetical protein
MTNTATVEVYTSDEPWIVQHGAGRSADRVLVAGCEVTGEFTFSGRTWVNYRMPQGVRLPKGWDKGVDAVLAAPAEWVHVA